MSGPPGDVQPRALVADRADSVRVVGTPPPFVTGTFEDDYGNRYEISERMWVQLPHGRFVIHAWDGEAGFLIAQNHADNTHAPGLWTRIDWVELEGMPPWGWAFCLTAYEAPTQAAARETATADRANPREGCAGFPFSRMKPVG